MWEYVTLLEKTDTIAGESCDEYEQNGSSRSNICDREQFKAYVYYR